MAMSEREFKRLVGAVEANRKDLSPFIEKFKDTVEEFAGSGYGSNDAKALPLNMVRMFTTVQTRIMSSKNPVVNVGTEYRELASATERLERALNYQVKRMNFAGTMKRVDQAGIMGVGLAKVGLQATRQVEWEGQTSYLPEPFVKHVALEDAILDLSAKDWESQQFIGHRYLATSEEIQQRFGVSEGDAKRWEEENGFQFDEDGNEKLSKLTNKQGGRNDKFFRPLIELAEVYVKDTGGVVTYPVAEETNKLDERAYYGPDTGPMDRLAFTEVPGQVLPVPPVTLIRDLHDAINYVYRKCVAQAGRQKTLFGVRGNAIKDIERQMRAKDGYAVKLDSPNGVAKLDFPGVNRESLAFVIDAMARVNFMGGNLEVLAGLGAQADTLGQEQIMAAGANKLAEEMTDAHYTMCNWALRAVGLYMWEDELIELPLSHRIPGSNYEIRSVWNPDQRRGEFLDHNISIEYGSMAPQNGAAKFNTLLTFMERILMPMMADLQARGITLDVETVARLASKMLGLKELEQILIFSNPTEAPKTPVGESVRSPISTRRYVRENKSTRTQRGTDNALTSMLLGGGQPSEAASLTGSPTTV